MTSVYFLSSRSTSVTLAICTLPVKMLTVFPKKKMKKKREKKRKKEERKKGMIRRCNACNARSKGK